MFHTKCQTVALCIIALAIMMLGVGQSAQAQPPQTTAMQPSVKTNQAQLTLTGAERAVAASRKQAVAIGVSVNIAVVDARGHWLAFARMDVPGPAVFIPQSPKQPPVQLIERQPGPLEILIPQHN